MNLRGCIEAFILASDHSELCITVTGHTIWLVASLFPFAEEKEQVREAILNCTLPGRNKQDEDVLESDDEEE